MAVAQKTIRQMVKRHAPAIKELALKVHANPEPGFEEVKACAWQVEMLRAHGFKVIEGVAGLRTAFRAEIGSGKPVLGICSEYDALPGIGHGCGHNLIAGCSIGTGLVLADLIKSKRLKGTLALLGTPAEEAKGGKVLMLKRGAFKGVDAVIMAHPAGRSTPDSGYTALRSFEVSFRGEAAHAAASPEKGKNSLDAAMLLFHGVNAWREHLPDGVRVHGIVNKGGVLPNIVPDYSLCTFFLRAADERTIDGMERRFRAIVRGAGLMTDTRPTIKQWLLPYKATRPNAPLNESYFQAASAAGLNPQNTLALGRGSTDFGDVSQIMPGVHVSFGILQEGKGIAIHSHEFARAAASSFALESMLRMVEVLSMMGIRYMADAAFRKQVHADFKARA